MTNVHFSNDFATTSGTFTRALLSSSSDAKPKPNPLLVLIHGGGINSSYFENVLHSTASFSQNPHEFNENGYDVLNLNRVGYGGNPVSKSNTPLFDVAPLYAGFINKMYQENHGGQGGVVLIGHSLGAATAIIVAALQGKNIPLLGVSALGIVPTREPPALIQAAVDADLEGERIPLGQPDELYLKRFYGAPELFDPTKLPKLIPILEEGRNELTEWLKPSTYDKFVTEITPAITVPLQYLAAEIEIQWTSIEEGRPIFEKAKSIFPNTSRLDADLLPGGAHNYDFSINSSRLRERRLQFIRSLY